jgi:NADH-quinone oxidoreductase subunit N
LYGLGGSTRLDTIAAALQRQFAASGVLSPFIWVAAILILAGLAFRLAAVPFHFYAPDVFQGTSSANAGLLSTLPKIAGLLVLIRLLAGAMPGIESLAWKFAWAMSVLTMTLGNIVALWQTNIRRLFAYSSIAHAGYMLIGVSVGLAQMGWAPLQDPAQAGGVNGLGSAVFYLAVYGLATLGTFAALTYLGNGRGEVNDIDELAGLAQRRPAVAAAIAVFMFSLAGVPPLAGFWGKFSLFSGAIDMGAPIAGNRNELEAWFLALAILGVLNAAIAAAYYLRVVATMYFRAPASAAGAVPVARKVEHSDAAPAIATALCTALVIIAGILPGGLLEASNAAGTSVSDRSSAHQSVAEPSQAALLSEPASLNAPSAP